MCSASTLTTEHTGQTTCMHVRLVTAKYEHLGKHERDEGSSSVGWVYALDQLKKKKCNMQSTPVMELFGVGVFLGGSWT